MENALSYIDRIEEMVDCLALPPWMKLFLFGSPSRRGPRSMAKEECPDIDLLINDFASKPSNMALDLTCSQMAYTIGVSARALRLYFQLELSQDFRTWKAEKKMELAEQFLMEDPDISASEIGEILGFSDKSSFFRCFKTRRGISPNQWRKKKKGLL